MFYGCNPSFEYTETPSDIHSHPDHDPRLEGVDLVEEIKLLKKIGALEVKETKVDLDGDGERNGTINYITLTSWSSISITKDSSSGAAGLGGTGV